jgi:dipeptidase E
MNNMKLLLLSNSTNPGETYLEYPKDEIKLFLGTYSVKALFIPYAAVTFSYDEYEVKVKERFVEMGHDVVSIHHFADPVSAMEDAEAIVVGGGNTFSLLRNLKLNGLLEIIRNRVIGGLPYIGWSAGSNITCPTICTTNDMPIIEPMGFEALNLLPFQINPHYTDFVPPGFGGETRDQRIAEFLAANRGITVVGLREGTLLKYENSLLKLIGPYSAKIFRFNEIPFESNDSFDFNLLLQ